MRFDTAPVVAAVDAALGPCPNLQVQLAVLDFCFRQRQAAIPPVIEIDGSQAQEAPQQAPVSHESVGTAAPGEVRFNEALVAALPAEKRKELEKLPEGTIAVLKDGKVSYVDAPKLTGALQQGWAWLASGPSTAVPSEVPAAPQQAPAPPGRPPAEEPEEITEKEAVKEAPPPPEPDPELVEFAGAHQSLTAWLLATLPSFAGKTPEKAPTAKTPGVEGEVVMAQLHRDALAAEVGNDFKLGCPHPGCDGRRRNCTLRQALKLLASNPEFPMTSAKRRGPWGPLYVMERPARMAG